MLKTCIKHEWRTFWKLPMILCAITVAMTLLGVLLLNSRIWETKNGAVSILIGIAMTIYIMMLMAVPTVTAIYTASRFYKTCYSYEGYLTQTLPISKHEIITSKLIVGTIWNALASVFMFLSVSVIIIGVVGVVAPDEVREIVKEIKQAYELCNIPFALGIIMTLIMFIVSTASSVMVYFASVSLGQTFTKHRVIGAILYYFVITMVIQVVSYAIMLPTMAFSYIVNGKEVFNTYDYRFDTASLIATIAMTIAFAIIGVVCYLICYHMMKKKLNLE